MSKYYMLKTTKRWVAGRTKSGNKKWTLIETELDKPVSLDHWANIVASVDWFKGLGGKELPHYTYTEIGLVLTRLVSISPDKSVKVEYSFKVMKKEEKEN